MTFKWKEGNWRELGYELITPSIESIACPWSRNIHRHGCYDRLFWSIYNEGPKTPLLIRPWQHQLTSCHTPNTDSQGNRFDNQPSPVYSDFPTYELILGNMRYCAMYTQRFTHVSALLLPESEYHIDINELWDKYHPYFEGNLYDDPDHQAPSKYAIGFG